MAKAKKKLAPGDSVPQEITELFEKHNRYLSAGKSNYARADKVLEQLIERCEPGVTITLPAVGKQPPRTVTLVDKFAESNQVWAGSSCKRLNVEYKDVKPQDR
jgi:hypothetical protein